MATNIGPKISIQGEAEYRRQIELLTACGKQLDSQMKLVAASFDKSADEQEKAAKKTEVLTQRIEAQKKQVEAMTAYYNKGQQKLQQYQKTLQQEIEMHGKDSAEAKKAQAEYERYSIALGKVEINLTKAKTSLASMQNELEESTQAAQSAGKELQDMGDEMSNAGKSAATFGDVLKANLLSQVVMDGFRKITEQAKQFASQMIDAAAALKAEEAQFDQTFGDLARDAERNLVQIGNAAGILPQRLRASYTQFFAYARSSGMESAAALDFATKATYAAADAAAYYDRSLEEVTEQVLAYTKGNYANDAALGFASTEATRNAQALKSMGKEYKDLDVTAGEMTQVLLDQIISAQKLSGALGQASRESDGWENVTGNLSATWRRFQGQIGRPVLENLTPRIQKLTASFEKWQNSLDMRKISKRVNDLFENIEKYGPQIIKTAVAIGKSFASWNIAQMTLKGGQAFWNLVEKVKSGGGIMQTALAAAGGGLGGFISLAVTAVPLAVAAYDALKEATKSSTERAIEEAEARVEGVRKSREAFAQLQKQQAEAAQGDLDQLDRVQTLARELDTLADASGNVQEKDQARAEFIVGQLNEALGLELEMINGQIEGYDQLQKSIQDTIAQKKFSILADAQLEVYNEALQRQNDLTREQAQAADDLQKQQFKVSEMLKVIEEWEKAVNIAVETGNDELQKKYEELYPDGLTALRGYTQDEQQLLGQMQSAYDETSAALSENWNAISSYEDAAAENLAGNTDKAIRMLQDMSSAYTNLTDDYRASEEQRKQIAAENYALALTALNDYLGRVQQKQDTYNRSRLQSLIDTAEDAKEEAMRTGVKIVDGTVEGLDGEKYRIDELLESISANGAETVKKYDADFVSAGTALGDGLVRGMESTYAQIQATAEKMGAIPNRAFRSVAQINSPSKVMKDDGIYTGEGLIEGMKAKLGAIEEMAARMGQAVMNGYAVPMLQQIYAPAIRQQEPAQRTAAAPSVGNITVQVYGHEGQDENAIADEVASRLQSMVARREVVWA